ncbi:MAG TPA: putative toxin-antitoxin system toxin component, PIN family [bacterium]
MRIVFDANVLVAAFAARGLCADLFEACLSTHECVAAPRILAETEDALRRKVRLPAPRATAIRRFLEEHLRVVTPAAVERDACRDPDDLPVLGAALAAGADCIVSGDRDLLELGSFRGIPILAPRALWERISAA